MGPGPFDRKLREESFPIGPKGPELDKMRVFVPGVTPGYPGVSPGYPGVTPGVPLGYPRGIPGVFQTGFREKKFKIAERF